jgi:predicted Zn-dependent protease
LKNTDDIDKAVDILLNIVKQDSNNTQSLSELYGIYKSGKSSVDIINQIHTLFDTNKNAVNAGYYLANFYYKNKNYTKALSITQEMIKRNTTQFKPVELYEMIFKIIINRPDRFAKEITYYLEKYQGLDKKNPLLIRLLRQNIMQTNFKETIFKNLDIPQSEETAKDYQIYAEYLIFMNAHNAARVIYNNGIRKFSDNFELFNSAFDFFKNPSELMALKNKFSHHNKNYHTILQAKLYLAQEKKQQAVALLKEKFIIDYHGLIADLLLTIDPTPETIALVDNNVKIIKDYSYEAIYRLAEILYKKSRLNEAANLLLPFLNTKKTDINYKLLLAQSSFYADFTMSNRLMNELVQEFPHRNDFLIHYIPYEVRNRNYKKAINLFEKNNLSMQEYPNIYFSYAYALLHTKKEKQGIKILHELIDSKQEFLERYNAVTLVEKFKNP